MSLWADFTLGMAGVTDLAFGTSYAADVYAAQTGKTPEQVETLREQAKKVNAKVVDQAAENTVDRIGWGLTKIAVVAGLGIVVVGGVALALAYSPAAKAAAKVA